MHQILQKWNFPKGMKTAKVLSIFKYGDIHDYTNYRLFILSQFSKMIEKVFDKRKSKFVDKYHLLDECQYGFRKGYSSTMALMDFLEGITTSLDNKETTIGVFIDMKKASDTINHEILLNKLFHYGG